MNTSDLKDKLVAVLGYGIEGKAVTEYLIKHGIVPVLFDQRPWEDFKLAERDQIRSLNVNVVFGPDCLLELRGFDVIFRSPGIPVMTTELQECAARGAVITSQVKWFFDHCPAPIIGVTGTKGKGTTSSLIFEILAREFIEAGGSNRAFLTGNIGKVQPFEILEQLTPQDWVVYELSSFQLQDLHKSPHIGVVLMVTQEHLDYHKNIAEYQEAKTPIVKFQSEKDIAVISADFPASLRIGGLSQGQKFFFSRRQDLDEGCFVKNGAVYLRLKDGEETLIVERHEVQVRGDHNLENICAAVLAAWNAGASLTSIRESIQSFKGLEHRLEFVAEKNGIKYYNDSFSTTPETAIAAIGAFAEPQVLILGGSSKNSDFTELGEVIALANNIKAVVLIGPEGERIKESMNVAGPFRGRLLEGATSMEEVVQQAESVASPGDVVVLSPACASFGMFENYKDRGEQFKKCVLKV